MKSLIKSKDGAHGDGAVRSMKCYAAESQRLRKAGRNELARQFDKLARREKDSDVRDAILLLGWDTEDTGHRKRAYRGSDVNPSILTQWCRSWAEVLELVMQHNDQSSPATPGRAASSAKQ